MAGVALAQRRPDLRVETAGTLTVDGQPISWRTRAALDDVGLPIPRHRSRQATADLLAAADLIVGLAPEHVEWVRREHRADAGRAGTLIGIAESLVAPPPPLAHRVRALGLAERALDPGEEIVDPGGGDVDAFVASARRIVALVDRLADRL